MEPPSTTFGADVTVRQAVGLCVALCLGTMVEWYDFTIYSQLSSTLTTVFFPKNNPATAALAFWGVYAVGFISRPIGAIIFGHIGDSIGRRLSLLISILLITLPTAIIGALPTYDQAGIAAPVVLAFLRFLQGVAVGGEYGSAIVYLYEMAPKHRKGVLASLGQQAIAPGIIFGIAACLIVLYACSPDQLLVWGWRLPFLVSIVTAPIALVLRMHMPEPHEFLHNKQEMVLQRVVSTAASKVARSYTHRLPSHASRTAPRLTSRQVSMRLQSLSKITVDPEEAPVGKAGVVIDVAGSEGSKASPKQHVVEEVTQKLPRAASLHIGNCTRREMLAREKSIASEVHLSVYKDAEGGLDDLDCQREYAAEVDELSKKVKHHVPIMVLFKHHWQGLLLQFFLEAVQGSVFYIFFSWAPPHLHTVTGVSTHMTLWSLMIGMGVFMITVPVTGYLVDKGVPKVWCYMGLTFAAGASAIPVMYGLYTGSLVALFVLLPFMFSFCGSIGGLITSIGPQIYPSAVRTSGFNLGHGLAMSIWGGLSPLVISALALVVDPAGLAAGVVIVILAVVSWIAAVLLIKVVPMTNAHDFHIDGCSCSRKSTAGEIESDSH